MNMGEVIVTFKVMPTGVDVDLDALEAQINEAVKADRIKREPIAFGLVALNVIKIVQDAAGVVDEVETELTKIEGVGSVEVTGLTKTL
jgi:elongation factor 1-beta